MDVKKIVFLHFALLQVHELDSLRHEIFEFGIFENFQKTKQIRLLEKSVVIKMYDIKGNAYQYVVLHNN